MLHPSLNKSVQIKQVRMMKAKTLILIFISIALQAFPQSEIETSSRSTLKAIRITEEFYLDGKLLESIYTQPPIKEFTQRNPEQGAEPTEESHVWFSYDEENIYVGAKLYDSMPELIDRSIARRDNEFNSDWFFVYLDTYNDNKTGYYFGINAGGTIRDGILYNDSWSNSSWDGIWYSKTSIEDDGWCVEIQIPFSQLRYKDSQELIWGVNFSRDIKRNNEEDFFVMVPKEQSGFVSRFATIEGIKNINSSQRFEVIPYIVQKAQYLQHDAGDPF